MSAPTSAQNSTTAAHPNALRSAIMNAAPPFSRGRCRTLPMIDTGIVINDRATTKSPSGGTWPKGTPKRFKIRKSTANAVTVPAPMRAPLIHGVFGIHPQPISNSYAPLFLPRPFPKVPCLNSGFFVILETCPLGKRAQRLYRFDLTGQKTRLRIIENLFHSAP